MRAGRPGSRRPETVTCRPWADTPTTSGGRAYAPPRGPHEPGAHPKPVSTRELDPAALGDSIDRLYRAAWALCGHREDAEDLVQETYARVLARPRLLRREDDVGYLLRALRHVFLNRQRAARSRPETVDLPEREKLEDRRAPEPQALVEAQTLYAAIANLPADFRDAVVAVDVGGLSYREAARALSVKEATVATRVFRARLRLVRDMEGMEPQ